MTLREELKDQLMRAGGRTGCVTDVLKDISRTEGLDLSSYILKFESITQDILTQQRALKELLP